MRAIRSFLPRRSVFVRPLLEVRKYLISDPLRYLKTKEALREPRCGRRRVYYLGIPVHANLGDLAQGMCIRKWLAKHFPERQVVEIETNALVNTCVSALKMLVRDWREGDLIVFQSGYTTTDLGGFADEMHRAVMSAMPDAPMLMMPQTVYFKSKENEERTSRCYNATTRMLFLARDKVSFDAAKRMLPDVEIRLYPDIVTTLIGTRCWEGERNGILMCCRNDSEKYYSESEISWLVKKLMEVDEVSVTDTTKSGKQRDVVKNADRYIWAEIERYARYRCVVTDRYHGTIFALIAGTPVVVLKTSDHKVTTGVDWFEGIYDTHVRRAVDLVHAIELVTEICGSNVEPIGQPYFEEYWYDRLPNLLAECVGDN